MALAAVDHLPSAQPHVTASPLCKQLTLRSHPLGRLREASSTERMRCSTFTSSASSERWSSPRSLLTLPTPPLQRPSSHSPLCRWPQTRSSFARTRRWGRCSRLEGGEVGKASVSGKAGAGTVPKCHHVMLPVGHSAEEGDIARIRPVCRVCSVRGCCVSVEYCQCTKWISCIMSSSLFTTVIPDIVYTRLYSHHRPSLYTTSSSPPRCEVHATRCTPWGAASLSPR